MENDLTAVSVAIRNYAKICISSCTGWFLSEQPLQLTIWPVLKSKQHLNRLLLWKNGSASWSELTTATISAAFPRGQRIIGTAPDQRQQHILIKSHSTEHMKTLKTERLNTKHD